MEKIELPNIPAARDRIMPFLHRTPTLTSRYISELTGADIYLKAELFQKTGAFKPRGALNRLKNFTAEQKANGIVTCSAGNHAQATAFACSMEKLPCVVVMPSHAPQSKLDATRNYGATVVLHDDLRTIFDRTEEVRRERNGLLLHPFDDPFVIAGQGTVGLEIYEDVPDADMAIVGIGGGALIAGISLALKSLNPKIRVIGVEPTGAATMTRAKEVGKPVRLEKIQSVADGLAAPYVGERPFQVAQNYVDEVVLVEDDEIIRAVKLLLERTKLLVEPAGAACLAALMTGKIHNPGRKIVLVLSGGNVDLSRLQSWYDSPAL